MVTVPNRQIAIIVNRNNPTQTSTQSVTPTQTTAVVRLDQLIDVQEGTPESGSVPVYNANTDKYIVSKLTLADIDGGGTIDGGSF